MPRLMTLSGRWLDITQEQWETLNPPKERKTLEKVELDGETNTEAVAEEAN